MPTVPETGGVPWSAAEGPRPGPRVCYVSHRLGGYDGVSIEAAKWQRALAHLGFDITRVAGYFADQADGTDVELDGLWAAVAGELPPPPDIGAITDLCRSHDVLILDNVGTLPSATPCALAFETAALRAGIPTIVRHHDPPWQVSITQCASHPRFPLHDPRMLHVAINRHTEHEFRCRYPELKQFNAITTVYNTVDIASLQTGRRRVTRRAMNIGDRDILVAHPARNIPRKNVPAAIEFASQLHLRSRMRVHYWLTDPVGDIAGDGNVVIHRGHAENMADLYAAADFVALPSVWEGWGLPVVESAAAHRIAVTNRYPILDEIHSQGIVTIDTENIETASQLIRNRTRYRAVATNNYRSARRLDSQELPTTLQQAISRAASLTAQRAGGNFPGHTPRHLNESSID